jgi:hypothetical protein
MIFTVSAILGLFFFLFSGAMGYVLAEKWNWLTREDRNMMIFFTLFCFVVALVCFGGVLSQI